jgi:hypothetical protein
MFVAWITAVYLNTISKMGCGSARTATEERYALPLPNLYLLAQSVPRAIYKSWRMKTLSEPKGRRHESMQRGERRLLEV